MPFGRLSRYWKRRLPQRRSRPRAARRQPPFGRHACNVLPAGVSARVGAETAGISDEHTKRVLFCGVGIRLVCPCFPRKSSKTKTSFSFDSVETLRAPVSPRTARRALRSRARTWRRPEGRARRGRRRRAGVPNRARPRRATRRRVRGERTRPARRARAWSRNSAPLESSAHDGGAAGETRRDSAARGARKAAALAAATRTLQPRLRNSSRRSTRGSSVISASTSPARSRASIEPGLAVRPAAPALAQRRDGARVRARRGRRPGKATARAHQHVARIGRVFTRRATSGVGASFAAAFTSRSRIRARRHRAPELAHGQRRRSADAETKRLRRKSRRAASAAEARRRGAASSSCRPRIRRSEAEIRARGCPVGEAREEWGGGETRAGVSSASVEICAARFRFPLETRAFASRKSPRDASRMRRARTPRRRCPARPPPPRPAASSRLEAPGAPLRGFDIDTAIAFLPTRSPVTVAPPGRRRAARARAAGSRARDREREGLNTLVSGSRATNADSGGSISRCRVSCTAGPVDEASPASRSMTRLARRTAMGSSRMSRRGTGRGGNRLRSGVERSTHTPPPHMVRFSPRNGFLRQMKDRDPSARAPRKPTRTSVARPPGSFESRRRDRDREPTARGKHPPPRCVRRVPRELRSVSVPLAFSSESAS